MESNLIAALQELMPSSTFVLSWRNGVEPPSPYCLVTILSTDQLGGAEESLHQDSGNQHLCTNQLSTVRLQFLGDSKSTAYSDCELLKLLMFSFNGRNAFSRNGMSILEINGVKRAGLTRDTKMYITSILDITLLYKQYTNFTQYSIDTVEMTGDLSDNEITINLP